MKNLSTIMPKTFVKDLPGIEKIRPEYVDAFDSFLYEWTESMLPYYEEFKRKVADVFECLSATTFGEDWAECYEYKGQNYRFNDTPLWGRTLSLNGKFKNPELNWRNCFWNKYPEYDGSKIENFREDNFFNWYFHRYSKKDPKYNVVTDRLRDYFRYLTGDSDIVFDVGWHSFIYRNPRIRSIIDHYPCWYY